MKDRSPQFKREVARQYHLEGRSTQWLGKKYNLPATTVQNWKDEIHHISFMKDDLTCVVKISKEDAALVKEILAVHEIKHYIPDNFKLTEMFKSKL